MTNGGGSITANPSVVGPVPTDLIDKLQKEIPIEQRHRNHVRSSRNASCPDRMVWAHPQARVPCPAVFLADPNAEVHEGKRVLHVKFHNTDKWSQVDTLCVQFGGKIMTCQSCLQKVIDKAVETMGPEQSAAATAALCGQILQGISKLHV